MRINAVAFISPQNHPILIRTFGQQNESIKYHYIAHTSLDVIEERVSGGSKSPDCYLGLLYSMEDVAVYGYITPLKVKIVVATAFSDAVVRDVEIITIFKALHMAYHAAAANPFLRLDPTTDSADPTRDVIPGGAKCKNFKQKVDEIADIVNNPSNSGAI